ncbi:MAG: pilus assembly protein [Parcubacteria group bacterium]|nr:pilus assembly protein [Parcubacteria group bacterium]|tara:strand:- start:8872 stop:9456 length:585 start_codon:yes stop_codon:yes gene_type:complete
MKKIQRGFTLLELMVTIAIVVIVAAIAFWDSSDMLENNRAENFLLELKRNLSYARSQAASTDEIVIVCPVSHTQLQNKSDSLKCLEAWGSDNSIIIFVDKITTEENRKDKTASYLSDEDSLIAVIEQTNANDKLKFTGNESILRFESNGLISYSPGDFIYCPSNDNQNNKALTVSKSGTSFYIGETDETCVTKN